jgi:hypothetical protein
MTGVMRRGGALKVSRTWNYDLDWKVHEVGFKHEVVVVQASWGC